LRCYAPRTGTLVIAGIILCLLFTHGGGHVLSAFGLIAEVFAVSAGFAVVAATLVLTARAVQRRRAAEGGCTTCRFNCQHELPQPRRRMLRMPKPSMPALAVRYERIGPPKTAPAIADAPATTAATGSTTTPGSMAATAVATAPATAAAATPAASAPAGFWPGQPMPGDARIRGHARGPADGRSGEPLPWPERELVPAGYQDSGGVSP
jgi:hypothetical protein